tara:strand:- start:110 stop:289 length:180 start_codon:yes stop_codon:yes gene_type:complete
MKNRKLELLKFIKFHQDRIEHIVERKLDSNYPLYGHVMNVLADHKKAIEDYKKEIAELN